MVYSENCDLAHFEHSREINSINFNCHFASGSRILTFRFFGKIAFCSFGRKWALFEDSVFPPKKKKWTFKIYWNYHIYLIGVLKWCQHLQYTILLTTKNLFQHFFLFFVFLKIKFTDTILPSLRNNDNGSMIYPEHSEMRLVQIHRAHFFHRDSTHQTRI